MLVGNKKYISAAFRKYSHKFKSGTTAWRMLADFSGQAQTVFFTSSDIQ
jgi:hypothetical protein